jgi:protein TonB
MSALLKKIDAHLPFNKTERIIIALVLALHALPLLEFLHFSSKPSQPDDERVMANLIAPETPQSQSTPVAPKPVPPKPKEEPKKKTVDDKSSQKPIPKQTSESTSQAQQQNKADSPSQMQNASVAPATNGGSSGTPIQTDIGKLEVVYEPDADAYYPSFSKRSGEQGSVVVRLIIDETGVVEDIALLQSSTYPRLDRAATEIGKRYRFKPFIVKGSPQRISTNLLIKFNLKN